MPKFQGRTVAAAQAAASQALGQPVTQLKITVVDPGRRGWLGFGQRPAVVEATVVAPTPTPKVNAAAPKSASVGTSVAPTVVKAGRRMSGASASPAPSVPAEAADSAARGELTLEEQAARHAKNLAQLQTALPGLTDYLNGVFRALGVAAVTTVKRARVHEVLVEVETASPGRVIGHHGRRINAVEELGTAWLTYHGATDPGLVLDTAGYRERRQETVADIATDVALEVVATGRAVFLDPMPARERRELHQLLAKDGRVRTYSRGREPFRAVVVAPK